jgi:hypothetical protein
MTKRRWVMRPTRLRILLGVLAAGACLALPSVASAQAPAQDSVVGSGATELVGTPRFSFEIDARSGPSGENPTGTAGVALILAPQISAQGPVTCLTVTGNRAVIGFRNTLGGFQGVLGAFLEVTDGTPDTLEFVNPWPVPTVCPSSLGLPPGPVVSGDIVVIDAQPFPTSKDECKNGGWRNFPGFKNQGDCVSFVATGGRNAPAINRPNPSQ